MDIITKNKIVKSIKSLLPNNTLLEKNDKSNISKLITILSNRYSVQHEAVEKVINAFFLNTVESLDPIETKIHLESAISKLQSSYQLPIDNIIADETETVVINSQKVEKIISIDEQKKIALNEFWKNKHNLTFNELEQTYKKFGFDNVKIRRQTVQEHEYSQIATFLRKNLYEARMNRTESRMNNGLYAIMGKSGSIDFIYDTFVISDNPQYTLPADPKKRRFMFVLESSHLDSEGNEVASRLKIRKERRQDFIDLTLTIKPAFVWFLCRIKFITPHIHDNAYRNYGLTEYELSDDTISIGAFAFADNLLDYQEEPFKIPLTVKEVKIGAFTNNPKLALISLSETLFNSYTEITELDERFGEGVLYFNILTGEQFDLPNEIGAKKYLSQGLTEFTFLDKITIIGDSAFRRNNLTNITLPPNLLTIGERAFASNDLSEITLPTSVRFVGNEAFFRNPNLIKVVLSETLFNTFNKLELLSRFGDKAEYFTHDGTALRIPYLEIADSEYANLNINNFEIPILIDVIGVSAFQNNLINYIELPPNLKIIKAYAFKSNSLSSIRIPETVVEIGKQAFANNNIYMRVFLSEALFNKYTKTELENRFGLYSTFYSLEGIELKKVLEIPTLQYDRSGLLGDVSHLISEEIRIIKPYAFRGNVITSITLPQSLKRIEEGAFRTNNLTSITIPRNVNYIGNSAFGLNYFLTEVILTRKLFDSFTEAELINRFGELAHYYDIDRPLNGGAVYDQIDVRTITDYHYADEDIEGTYKVPYSVHFIGEQAFANNNINFFILPESLEELSTSFSGNPIEKVIISDGLYTYYQSRLSEFFGNEVEYFNHDNERLGGIITTITSRQYLSNNIRGDASAFMPQHLKIIESEAFSNNPISSITFPETLEEIHYLAFLSNRFVEVILPASVKVLQEQCFTFNHGLTKVVMSQELFDSYSTEALKSRFKDNVDYFTHDGTELTKTGDELLQVIKIREYFNDSLREDQSSKVPEGIITIWDEAFYYNKITSITLPSTLGYIGRQAFQNNLLTEITIPENVYFIESNAFYGNPDLITVRMSEKLFKSLTSGQLTSRFGRAALYYNLDNEPLGAISENAIIRQKSFINIGLENDVSNLLPHTIRRIERFAFANNQIRSATLPQALEVIQVGAFYSNRFSEITIPKNVKLLQDWAFANTQVGYFLSRVVMSLELFDSFSSTALLSRFGPQASYFTHEGVQLIKDPDSEQITEITIRQYADQRLRRDQSDKVPEGIITIRKEAFFDNSITGITLPSTLEFIENFAFKLNRFRTIIIPEKVYYVGEGAFEGNIITRVKMTKKLFDVMTTDELEECFGSQAAYYDFNTDLLLQK